MLNTVLSKLWTKITFWRLHLCQLLCGCVSGFNEVFKTQLVLLIFFCIESVVWVVLIHNSRSVVDILCFQVWHHYRSGDSDGFRTNRATGTRLQKYWESPNSGGLFSVLGGHDPIFKWFTVWKIKVNQWFLKYWGTCPPWDCHPFSHPSLVTSLWCRVLEYLLPVGARGDLLELQRGGLMPKRCQFQNGAKTIFGMTIDSCVYRYYTIHV